MGYHTRDMLRTLKIYPALLRAYWQRALVYRATYLVVLVNASFPLVMMAIWIGLAQGGAIQGYGAAGFAAYYLAAILVRRITGCGIVRDIELLVRNGDLSVYLLRPLDVVHFYIARVLTARLITIPIVAAPVLIGMLITPGIQLNLTPYNLALFALACAVGLAFEFTAQYAIGGLSFWMTQAHGASAAFTLAESFLGGYIVPLALFPATLQIVLQALPFQGSVALPVEILIGRVTPDAAAARILLCAAWVFAIALGARLIWRAGVRSFSAVGA